MAVGGGARGGVAVDVSSTAGRVISKISNLIRKILRVVF